MKILDKRTRWLRIISVSCIIVLLSMQTVTLADDEENYLDDEQIQNEIMQTINSEESNAIETGTSNENKKPTLNSRRYAVYDRASGTTVYGKDENRQTAMASTTKIMTAVIVLENCQDLNETVTIEAKAATTGGSRLGLQNGDKITINDLLYGLLLRSGNDAAIALAIHVGGDVKGFAELMNNKAKELKLKNTNFVTPHGLDDPNHFTTVSELAKLTDYALRNVKFSQIVKTTITTISINGNNKEIKNTNELLCGNIEGVYGVKTGFTNIAGRCLVTSVKRNDMDLIIVVLGADTRKDRAQDTLKLIDYSFKTFRTENIENLVEEEFDMWQNINLKRIFVYKGRNNLKVEMNQIPIKNIVTNKEISISINSINYLEAPVLKGTKIGTITVKNGEDILEEIDIVTADTVEKFKIFDYIRMMANTIAA